MSSNIKPKLARHPELELSFAAERPGLAAAPAWLPEPLRA